jgi:hypothetical protein
VRPGFRHVLAFLAIAGAVYIVVIASHVYGQAGLYLKRATYVAECVPQPSEGATSSDCARLGSNPPAWPDGVEIDDETSLIAYAQSMQSTGTGIYTLAALWLAGFGVAAALLSRQRTQPCRVGVSPVAHRQTDTAADALVTKAILGLPLHSPRSPGSEGVNP